MAGHKSISRRTFLVASGAVVAAGAAGGFYLAERQVDRRLEFAEPEIDESRFNFCGICSANCAMIADIADGKVWRIRGNPDDQVAAGHLCVKGYSATMDLYDPDRLKYPMKRTSPEKGPGVDPGWVKIDWDEAFQLTADAYNQAIEEHGPQSLAFFSRGHDWMNRLQRAIGTPNHIQHHSTCFTTYTAIWRAALGTGNRPFMLDIAKAKYILSFGWDQPSKAKNMSARHYIEALSNGAKVVYIDPRLTITGSLGGEWIPIKPGTDLAFMLAMIRIIINEELYDKDYVDNYTSGFEELSEAVQEYTPQWAAEITGVEAGLIEKISREFAGTKPALIPNHKRDAGGPNYANSWRAAFCKVILNALVGSIDREGGQTLPRRASMPGFDDVFPPTEFPEMDPERIDGFEKHPIIGPTRRGDFATVTDAILDEKPYPLKVAFFRKHNILAFPDAPKFTEALKKLDFIAVADVWPSEMVQMADVVFPEPYYLETSGFGERLYYAMHPQIALREPVIDPLYDTKGYGGIITGLAQAMGYGEYFEGVSGGEFNEKRLEAAGTSWEDLQNSPNGLWTDEKPFQGREEWGTPSSKIELYSTVLEENGYDPLPYWQPKREMPSDQYPYYFLISRPPMHKMSQTQNNELMLQAYGKKPGVMINRKTAEEQGIADGDDVVVKSRANQITLKAELTEGIRPDCVCIEHGFGHWSKELTLAFNLGANEGDLIPTVPIDEMLAAKDPGAGSMMTDFCVSISRA